MSLFEYQALDPRGRRKNGLLQAESLAHARESLTREGFFPVSLKESSVPRVADGSPSLTRRVSRADLASATRQLATLLKAGLPLVAAFDALIEQMERPALRRALSSVRASINEGKALHEALGEDPAVFPPLYVQMVRAGEVGGFLDNVMERLAQTLEGEERLRGRIRAAMVYPALMTVLGFLFLLFLFAYVIPQVVGIFADYGRALPLPTRILLVVSHALSRFWFLVLLFPLALLFLYRGFNASQRFGPLVDAAKLKVPFLGRFLLKAAMVRLTYVLGTLLGSGVPMLRSLEVASRVVGNRVLSTALEQVGEMVRRGEPLAASLRATGVFPPLLSRVTAVGEKSGDLARMMARMGESYEEELARSLAAAASILEPLLIVVMGGVVLFVVVSILLPIFELNQLVRGG